jgi:8-oxo-dGTP pyrophosphatase MutT (NUDIX family)
MTGVRIVRRVARVLLIDPDDALLLIRGHDPAKPAAGDWWFTPGGGIEGAESYLDAARREVLEETGMRLADVRELRGERQAEFDFDGSHYVQRERYFAARLDRFVPASTGWTDLERRSTLEMRWWSASEFAASAVLSFPDDLGARWESAVRLLRGTSGRND